MHEPGVGPPLDIWENIRIHNGRKYRKLKINFLKLFFYPKLRED
jgi:hypothetical protein